ncbi:putative phosphoribosyltransferase [Archaeoglobus sulfaticallidus PM70-1]|uniref:Putative phosphoribosyltransferase n=1 Tax=Archaeoglobus sulfaticallidus PM70-1 TaxID=387631 RepID=N0BAW1_9EURY|nr:phosphoribosyltransferase [Archaeoglobus sulfaticallidus]AGK60744.1 putative phosphoribosyltransferase [Archaeoglobus sulfaticallidus PM70-1]
MFRCITYNWNDIYRSCIDLGVKIAESFSPDVIVAIARGGWVPARILCDVLDVRELYSIKAVHWGRVATKNEARIVQKLNVDLTGKKVLIVDDVTDTGETVLLAKEHIKELNAEEVRIAVVDHKRTSKFQPDFYANLNEEWMWIVYPWSCYEDARDLIEKNELQNEDPERIKEILKERHDFNVDLDIIKYVLKKFE